MNLKTFTTRIYPLLFVFAFFGVILFPMRNLTFSPSDIETGFYGRDWLIRAFNDFRVTIGDRVFPKAVIGKDGWVFFTAEKSIDDYQNAIPFSRQDLAEMYQKIKIVNADLASRGIKLLIVIAPNKSSIYPDYMPAEIPVIGKVSRLDQMLRYLKQRKSAVQILDLRPALREMRKTNPVYYATDTHWNDYGAYTAYSRIIARLKRDFPILTPYALDKFEYVSLGMQNLDLTANMGTSLLKEERFQLTPAFDTTTRYKTLPLEDGRRITLSWNPNQKLPRALIYHDSYFFQVNAMLGAHFSNAVYIPHYTGAGIWDLGWIEQQDPDIVIVEFAERYLHDLPRLVEP